MLPISMFMILFPFFYLMGGASPRFLSYTISVLYESYPMKLCKKNNSRGVLSLSRALLGQLNSSKPGEAIALQITGSLSDNKVSVFTNKSALH